MPKPPGRILPDLTSSPPEPEGPDEFRDEILADWRARQEWYKTPAGRRCLAFVERMQEAEAAVRAEEAECRSDRILKGLPAYVEPKTIHAQVPSPPWKRKLRP